MPELGPVFLSLRAIMAPYAAALDVTKDDESELCLYTRHVMKNKKALFFGAVQIRKAYVSYHLMPVYVKPALLATLSTELRKRMQGKSCFNFSAIDERLFKELSKLTKAAYSSYEEEGFL